jgi:ABC-2 type transport system ATP-binding protein
VVSAAAAAEPAAPAAEVEELTRRFDGFTAVDAVSFTVERAEVFGFLGPNGAGKTTLLKMLVGLLAPSAGRARVAGYDVATQSEQVKQHIGYMSQRFSLYTDLTVDENVRLFGGLYGVSGRRLDTRRGEMLEMARLTAARHRRVAELPLGFRQRLALGCAVLHQPPILFLDEPTSGVDPVSRRGFWDLIYSLAEGGTTVFVTTHYMEEAEHCHRLALMNRGRLVALDRPEALRRDFGRRVVEVRTPDPAAAAEALEGARGVAAAGLYGRTVHATLAEGGNPGAVAAALGEAGVEVEGVEPIEPSLEDVFVALVEGAGGAREE